MEWVVGVGVGLDRLCAEGVIERRKCQKVPEVTPPGVGIGDWVLRFCGLRVEGLGSRVEGRGFGVEG